MSQYVQFFAAPGDAAAAAVRNRGPAGTYAFMDASEIHFDADDAVIAWRNLLTGRAGFVLTDRNELHMVADFVNDGSAVFALPDELLTTLIAAHPPRLLQVAEAWAPAMVEDDGVEIDVMTTAIILTGIADLARAAAGTADRLYCWVAC